MKQRLLISLSLLISFGLSTAHAQLVGDMADVLVTVSEPRLTQTGKKTSFTFTAERVDDAFNGVVVQGFAAAETLEGWIRFEQEEGWSDWQALYLVRSATDGGFMAAYRGPVFRQNQRFDLRFDLDGADDLDLLELGRAHV